MMEISEHFSSDFSNWPLANPCNVTCKGWRRQASRKNGRGQGAAPYKIPESAWRNRAYAETSHSTIAAAVHWLVDSMCPSPLLDLVQNPAAVKNEGYPNKLEMDSIVQLAREGEGGANNKGSMVRKN